MKRCTPGEKLAKLTTARQAMAEGKSEEEAARLIGEPLAKLKRWVSEQNRWSPNYAPPLKGSKS